MPQPNQQITATPLKVDGVSDLDPEGRIPLQQLINGTTGRIQRWANFPALPGDYSVLYVYWRQNNAETEIFKETYTRSMTNQSSRSH